MSMCCPVCGKPVTVPVYDEYIGEHPMGGYQTFVDAPVRECECEWTEAQCDALIAEALKRCDPYRV